MNEEKTLRDEFAMAALTIFTNSPYAMGLRESHVAEKVYAIADAMLEARKKKEV